MFENLLKCLFKKIQHRNLMWSQAHTIGLTSQIKIKRLAQGAGLNEIVFNITKSVKGDVRVICDAFNDLKKMLHGCQVKFNFIFYNLFIIFLIYKDIY